MTAVDTLLALGFEKADAEELQEISNYFGMSTPGQPHEVLEVYERGDILAVFEKNISQDNISTTDQPLMAVIAHPPVLILERKSDKLRACIGNYDEDDAPIGVVVTEMEKDGV